MLLQRHRRARVGKVEVLIVAVEIVVSGQRLVTNLHLAAHTHNVTDNVTDTTPLGDQC